MSTTLTNTQMVPKDFWGSVGNAIKDAVMWCGRTIKVLFTDYIVPGMKKIWPYILTGLTFIWEFLKTPAGLGTMGLIAGVSIGLALLSYANIESVEKEEDIVTRIMLRVFAGISFALGGAAFAVGIALGVG